MKIIKYFFAVVLSLIVLFGAGQLVTVMITFLKHPEAGVGFAFGELVGTFLITVFAGAGASFLISSARGTISGSVDDGAIEKDKQFPPSPKWKPGFSVPVEEIFERMKYYSNDDKDIVMFANGTAVLLPDGLNDEEAGKFAHDVLAQIYNAHPDMKPVEMDDGNILVQYNQPAFNVVISEFAGQHMDAIKEHHLGGLVPSEVLHTPQGNNVFDQFGMRALYGRTFMFMDAQNPEIVTLYRH